MTTVFRLDASIRKEGSFSRSIADTLQTTVSSELGGARIIHRDLGALPIPAVAWSDSVMAGFVDESQRTAEQKSARSLAAKLADELVASEAFIFAVPLYNFGVSQHFKLWVDLLLTDPRFAPGGEKLIAGRPAFLVTVRGGGYGPGTPRHGWDHATPWMLRILRDVLGLETQVIESELTLADVNPAMASLRDLAAQNLEKAHHLAVEHGKALTGRLDNERAA